MKNSIVELNRCELDVVSGGGHDYDNVTPMMALLVVLGTIAAMAVSTYIFDPIINSIERYFKGPKELDKNKIEQNGNSNCKDCCMQCCQKP